MNKKNLTYKIYIFNMNSNNISIKGIDKVQLLKKLWQGQIPADYFAMRGIRGPVFNEETAKEAVKKHIDYFCGRAIKTNLSGDEIDPYLYDRDAGQGKFAQIVDAMRNEEQK